MSPRPLSAAERRLVRGKLEVRAVADVRLGISDTVVPAGSVGFVLWASLRRPDLGWSVYWPSLRRDGACDPALLEPTGRRG